MNTNAKKVDVVRGSGAPMDRHALWFDDTDKQLKYNDGDGWLSSTSNNSSDSGSGDNSTIYNNIAPFVVLARPATEEELNTYASEYNWGVDDDIRIIELPANLKIPPVHIMVKNGYTFNTFRVDDWHFDTTYNMYNFGRYYVSYDDDNNMTSMSASSHGDNEGDLIYLYKIYEETNVLKFYFSYSL